jgi:nicotinate-nucleotide adenylyltransferase
VTQRIGLFGGTFDPPHLAHLILGEYAAEALGLSTLLFVPAADPPHKRNEEKTPVEHRLAMLALAVADNPRFTISRVDIDRPGPHYSVDTVQIVQSENPGADIFFVIGSDSLRDLLTWHRPDLLIERCTLAVIRRPGADVRPEMHQNELPGLAAQVQMVDAPLLEISSTSIARRLREGRSVRYLVPDGVLTYIGDNQLYCS